MKKGKVVILLNGRYAGRKAVIAHTNDSGNAKRPYAHAVVAGIERYPLKVTNTMSKKKVFKRSHIKPFIKTVNYSHILPTRYSFEGELPKELTGLDQAGKKKAKRAIRSVFQKKYVQFSKTSVLRFTGTLRVNKSGSSLNLTSKLRTLLWSNKMIVGTIFVFLEGCRNLCIQTLFFFTVPFIH